MLKGAADFLSSILIEDPEKHWLVTAPSNSPENSYITPNGFRGQTCMGPTIDLEICREIFASVIEASRMLKRDVEEAGKLDSLRKKLAPMQIGAAGDINEWLRDWKDAEPEHRHVSHLYGLHPYDEITPWSNPHLAHAARITLQQRGDGGTGWSKAWKINFWARLGEGEHAYVLLRELLSPILPGNKVVMTGGGTYPNLFCAHPPFQIDGNLGGAAGICEMILQSHGVNEVIRLLPALPSDSSWQEGRVKGIRARGAFTLDFAWKNGRVTKGKLVSMKGRTCNFLLPAFGIVRNAAGKIVARAGEKDMLVKFETKRGQSFLFECPESAG